MRCFRFFAAPSVPASIDWLQVPLHAESLNDLRAVWAAYGERLYRCEQRMLWSMAPLFLLGLGLTLAQPHGSILGGALLLGSVLVFGGSTLALLPRQLAVQRVQHDLNELPPPARAEFNWFVEHLAAGDTLHVHLIAHPRRPLYGELNALRAAYGPGAEGMAQVLAASRT